MSSSDSKIPSTPEAAAAQAQSREGAAPLPQTTAPPQHVPAGLYTLGEGVTRAERIAPYPYGSTSYQAGRTAAEASLKRYRYTGKERDEETGFYCYGVRYYAPWLGRWSACDPGGITQSPNLYTYVADNPVRYKDPTERWGEDMHFGAVYVASRLQGATPEEAMHVAIASQAMDDYRNLAAPSLKMRAVGTRSVGKVMFPLFGSVPVPPQGTTNDPLIEVAIGKVGIPSQEISPSPLPRQTDFLGFTHENPALQNLLANNAHALGVTRAESQEVAKLGIATNNLTTFGLGLHTVGDFLPHANTTGTPTFGHQIGKNEDYTDSNPTNHSADETFKNPRKALATFMDVMDMWAEMKHTAGGRVQLNQDQLNRLDFFLRSSDPSMKQWALEELLKSVGADNKEIDAFRKVATDPNDRRAKFEAQLATAEGHAGFRRAVDTWLSKPNDATLVVLKTDVTPYTDNPKLPNIAHVRFARVHNYPPPVHGF